MLLPGPAARQFGLAKAQTLLVLVFLRKRAGDYLPELLRGTSGAESAFVSTEVTPVEGRRATLPDRER
jgi:hypothetical protein